MNRFMKLVLIAAVIGGTFPLWFPVVAWAFLFCVSFWMAMVIFQTVAFVAVAAFAWSSK